MSSKVKRNLILLGSLIFVIFVQYIFDIVKETYIANKILRNDLRNEDEVKAMIYKKFKFCEDLPDYDAMDYCYIENRVWI